MKEGHDSITCSPPPQDCKTGPWVEAKERIVNSPGEMKSEHIKRACRVHSDSAQAGRRSSSHADKNEKRYSGENRWFEKPLSHVNTEPGHSIWWNTLVFSTCIEEAFAKITSHTAYRQFKDLIRPI